MSDYSAPIEGYWSVMCGVGTSRISDEEHGRLMADMCYVNSPIGKSSGLNKGWTSVYDIFGAETIIMHDAIMLMTKSTLATEARAARHHEARDKGIIALAPEADPEKEDWQK